jgi:hypothetical protein
MSDEAGHRENCPKYDRPCLGCSASAKCAACAILCICDEEERISVDINLVRLPGFRDPPPGCIEPSIHLRLRKGYYLIHPGIGRVWSMNQRGWLTPSCNNDGYIVLNMTLEDGTNKRISEHRVVKETKDGPTPPGECIDHIDRVKSNNKYTNLQFATRSLNTSNRDWSNNGKGIRRPIIQLTLKGEFVKEWSSAMEAAKVLSSEIKITQQGISACCCRIANEAGGYWWEYYEPDLPDETWKELGELKLSNLGRVRYPSGRVTYGSRTCGGYYVIMFKLQFLRVQNLVCEAYHGQRPQPDMIVNHKDESPANNRPENLEWMTSGDNTRYSRNVPVRCYSYPDRIFLDEYESITAAELETGDDKRSISSCCGGRSSRIGDRIWEYVNEKNPTIIHSLSKQVNQYNLHGRFIQTFSCMRVASKASGYSMHNIHNCCLEIIDRTGKFMWAFTDQRCDIEGNLVTTGVNDSSGPVEQQSLTGESIRLYSSITQASKVTGFGECEILKCRSGLVGNYEGFKWFHPSPRSKDSPILFGTFITKLSLRKERIAVYNSRSDAAKAVNGYSESMKKLSTMNLPYMGYCWRVSTVADLEWDTDNEESDELGTDNVTSGIIELHIDFRTLRNYNADVGYDIIQLKGFCGQLSLNFDPDATKRDLAALLTIKLDPTKVPALETLRVSEWQSGYTPDELRAFCDTLFISYRPRDTKKDLRRSLAFEIYPASDLADNVPLDIDILTGSAGKNGYTVVQLRAFCDARSITHTQKNTKEDLLRLLTISLTSVESTKPPSTDPELEILELSTGNKGYTLDTLKTYCDQHSITYQSHSHKRDLAKLLALKLYPTSDLAAKSTEELVVNPIDPDILKLSRGRGGYSTVQLRKYCDQESIKYKLSTGKIDLTRLLTEKLYP